jgi:hypothetical protein
VQNVAATNFSVRRQPCTRCGEKVVIVETNAAALGGLLRRAPSVRIEHADFEPGGEPDRVDEACRRGGADR